MKMKMNVNRNFLGLLAIVAMLFALPATALALTLHHHAHSSRSHSTEPSSSTTGVPEIGALYQNGSPDVHDCTASVVSSPKGDTIMTAAHCVSGNASGVTFVPDEHNGQAPYGRWTVVATHVTSSWISKQNPQDDVAFLTVAPREINGKLTEIQQVTGAYKLGSAARAGEKVRVTGYPAGTTNNAITCQAKIYMTKGYPSFDCSGYVDGTSGSPWLLSTRHGEEIVGVIGGLHQGGCVDNTSYSPVLSGAVQTAYRLAASLTSPDSAPSPGGNGC